MNNRNKNSIVSINWLKENLAHPDLVILDASQDKVRTNISSEFSDLTIKNSRDFDIKNKFSDTSNAYPNALPSAEQFEVNCQLLGINNSSIIVLFDRDGIFSSPRVWWLFKTMGHSNVAVLNGGFPEWIKQDFPIEKKQSKEYQKGDFKAKFNKELVRDFNEVVENTKSQKELLIDVRSENRFKCLVPEPRKGLRSGTIPNSINFPYTKVLEKGKFKEEKELKEIFKEVEKETKPFVFSCGSGITACIVYLAYEQISTKQNSIFDGSWTEWGSRMD